MLLTALNWVIHLPGLVLDLIFTHQGFEELKEIAKYPFICPNCGKSFFAKRYHLLWNRGMSVAMVNKAKLKCPHCKSKDMCKWTGTDKV